MCGVIVPADGAAATFVRCIIVERRAWPDRQRSGRYPVLVALETRLPLGFLAQENRRVQQAWLWRMNRTGLVMPGPFLSLRRMAQVSCDGELWLTLMEQTHPRLTEERQCA